MALDGIRVVFHTTAEEERALLKSTLGFSWVTIERAILHSADSLLSPPCLLLRSTLPNEACCSWGPGLFSLFVVLRQTQSRRPRPSSWKDWGVEGRDGSWGFHKGLKVECSCHGCHVHVFLLPILSTLTSPHLLAISAPAERSRIILLRRLIFAGPNAPVLFDLEQRDSISESSTSTSSSSIPREPTPPTSPKSPKSPKVRTRVRSFHVQRFDLVSHLLARGRTLFAPRPAFLVCHQHEAVPKDDLPVRKGIFAGVSRLFTK